MAKAKRITVREKRQRSEIKKELQEKGVLPPNKPKLNRKKYIEEARDEWNKKDACYFGWDYWLRRAIAITLGMTDKNFRASPEAVGVAKTLKIAIRLKEFHDKVEAEGRDSFKVIEQYEYIKDILEA